MATAGVPVAYIRSSELASEPGVLYGVVFSTINAGRVSPKFSVKVRLASHTVSQSRIGPGHVEQPDILGIEGVRKHNHCRRLGKRVLDMRY